MKVEKLIFSPFQVNTYIVSDETNECIIIDPSCLTAGEQKSLVNFIEENKLNPVKLLNTHLHLDHVFGNEFISKHFGLNAEASKDDEFLLNEVQDRAKSYGFEMAQPSPITKNLTENDTIKFGNSELQIFQIPGHSPGSLVFYSIKDKFAIVGDVLFNGSIGRTDLPGSDYNSLERGIKEKLYSLPDDTIVFSGHGEITLIGKEKMSNPFVRGI